MAKYNNQDQRNLEELLEEGIWDRMKARGSQALGAVKGGAQQLKGQAQQVAGGAVKKAGNLAAKGIEAVGGNIDPSKNKLTQAGEDLYQSGGENVEAGGTQAANAKLDSYAKSIDAKMNKLVDEITNDLSKLGIQISGRKRGLIQGASTNMKKHLLQAIQALKQ
jgi:hypothetical protein